MRAITSRIKFIALILLLALATSVLAESVPLTASARIKNMANEEATWRYLSGGGKLLVGALAAALGYTLFSFRDNILGAMILIPIGATVMIPGLISFGWGAMDLLFGSREYENQHDRLKTLTEPERENQAVNYLKEKAEKDRQGRQPNFWNGFGLFSVFPTPAEREYQAYLKDRKNF
jgi:hypothetical protein